MTKDETADENAGETVDVLVVGAGISGIGAGYHLQTYCPDRSYAIVEARPDLGGTWDLFRYPGVRSDSDMHTLGYGFRPWTDPKAIAEGPRILAYLRETAGEHGIDRRIRFGRKVLRADWSTPRAQWTVQLQHAETTQRPTIRLRFLFMCSGYYDYAAGHQPDFPGLERFGGRLVHPQQWPEDLDYAGRKVVVIGSGATAVTLVPALAEKAATSPCCNGRRPGIVSARPTSRPGRHAAVRRRIYPLALGVPGDADGKMCSSPWPVYQPLQPSTSRSRAQKGDQDSVCKGSSVPTPRLRRSTPTSPRGTTRGISGCAWCPTVTCSARCATAGPRW